MGLDEDAMENNLERLLIVLECLFVFVCVYFVETTNLGRGHDRLRLDLHLVEFMHTKFQSNAWQKDYHAHVQNEKCLNLVWKYVEDSGIWGGLDSSCLVYIVDCGFGRRCNGGTFGEMIV